ncbi:MAG: carbon-nitrogen hydrolase family protein [Planctomycetota bacterium]|nr:carbon-nitrogen hydrolase family protein [Planctomycetota bacterium]MDA1178976.1 carbon-nitrogen hydrolase family protein [Planctomycetota bacterium]
MSKASTLQPLRVGLVPIRAEFGDVAKNLANILDWIERAGAQGAKLVCFPETALQGYCSVPEVVRRLAEPADGPSCQAIHQYAQRLGLVVSLGMSLRQGERVFNSQVFIGPSGYLGAQHKIHLCGFDKVYDLASDWNVIDIGGWKMGTTICYDSEFPEAARILAVKGADLLLMSFANGRRNWKNQAAQVGDWQDEHMPFIPSRAYDNRMFVVGVNHGGEVRDVEGNALANPEGQEGVLEWAPRGSLHHWTGYAFAINPMGRLIAEADRTDHGEKLLTVDLDPALLDEARYPCPVKLPSGPDCGDFVHVRRTDTFAEILLPGRAEDRRSDRT